MPSIIVDADGQGSRLDRFLRRKDYYFPQSLFEKWSRQKKLLVNGQKAKASTRLNEGDELTFPDNAIPIPPPLEVTKIVYTEEEAREILRKMTIFEDDFIIAINKPTGLASQGGTGQRTSVDAICRAAYPSKKYRLTHRIDLETSGILLIAKSLKSASNMTQAFRERTVQKTYIAVCDGIFDIKQDTINLPIGHCDEDFESMATQGYDIKEAVTHYKVLRDMGEMSLVELSPKTGRTHQLRVHMSTLGHPILGDKKYGGSQAPRLMLHAWKIHFENYEIEADIPKEFPEMA